MWVTFQLNEYHVEECMRCVGSGWVIDTIILNVLIGTGSEMKASRKRYAG